ncbi:MAG TPA: helix-turn-helix transcriptional regulator [Bacteroidales bacterium]|nr:helix-turn-helix transcriptional regulator [Bacteroidales bacterium]
MIDRIQKIIQHKKLSSSRFADLIGVPRSTISHIISGRNNPSLEFMQKVLDAFPDVRTEWLVRGKGNMLVTEGTLFSGSSTGNIDLAGSKGHNPKAVVRPTHESSAEAKSSKIPFPEYVELPKETLDSSKTLTGKEKQDGKDNIYLNESLKNSEKTAETVHTTNKELYRVLFFYSDGSFTEFRPGTSN